MFKNYPNSTGFPGTILVAAVGYFAALYVLNSLSVPVILDEPASVSQLNGYPNATAFKATAFISLFTGVLVFLAAYFCKLRFPSTEVHTPPNSKLGADLVQFSIIAILLIIAMFPAVLALHGPFIEEGIHLSALHRMLNGQKPYEDFLFLYGPLMLYFPLAWVKLFGFSLVSLYSYIVLLELLVLLIVFAIIRRYSVNLLWRIVVFCLIASMLFNFALGPNQNGLRRIVGVAILFSISRDPFSKPIWLLNGVVLGGLLAYSHEFGGATAIGISAIYTAIAIKQKSVQAVAGLFAIGVISAITWLGLAYLFLGGGAATYFDTILGLAQSYGDREAAFPVALNLNTIAVLALLFVGVWQSGVSLAVPWKSSPATGDLIFVGATAYGIVILKSGLTRADVWHLDPAIFALALAFLLTLPARNVVMSRSIRYFATALIIVVSATMAIGNFPHASHLKKSIMLGYSEYLAGNSNVAAANSGGEFRGTIYENSSPSVELIELQEYFESEHPGEQVFPYRDLTSGINYRINLPVVGPFADDFVYGDGMGSRALSLLESSPELLVLMERSEYDWLKKGPTEPAPVAHQWISDRRLSFLTKVASVHFRAGPIENQLKMRRWRRLMGNQIVANYSVIFSTQSHVVLRVIESTE